MQREPKKTKLPVKIVTKTGKSTSSKVSPQEKSVSSKKKPVAVSDKVPPKPKAETSAKVSINAPKTKKTTAVDQLSKQEKAAANVSAKNLTAKTVIIKPETVKKKAQTSKKKFEVVIPEITQKPAKKKIKPIGSAVVRGKSGRYDFEIFPLDAEIKDGSAIYVISKRVTDKRGKGHHKFVCIGQTASLLGDLKKHAKGKCIKQYQANVVCLLREEDETNRLKIETDLRQAHTIVCNQK